MKQGQHNSISSWAFGASLSLKPLQARLDGLRHRVDRMEQHDRNQEGLARMENADPAFARAMTRKLVPDPGPVRPPEVIHQRVDGVVIAQRSR